MARGFESKSVADQQEAALARRPPREDDAEPDPARTLKRRKLELARADVMHRLETAHAAGHREILERALAAVDAELAGLS